MTHHVTPHHVTPHVKPHANSSTALYMGALAARKHHQETGVEQRPEQSTGGRSTVVDVVVVAMLVIAVAIWLLKKLA